MGLLSKIIAANVTTRIVKRLNQGGRERPVTGSTAAAPRQTYIPAGGNNLRDRAVQVYRDNPKMVAGVGVLLAAAALQQTPFFEYRSATSNPGVAPWPSSN
jgi:hypothetical protein